MCCLAEDVRRVAVGQLHQNGLHRLVICVLRGKTRKRKLLCQLSKGNVTFCVTNEVQVRGDTMYILPSHTHTVPVETFYDVHIVQLLTHEPLLHCTALK